MFHVKHFLFQTENICLNQRTIKEAMRGRIAFPSAMANTVYNDWLHNVWKDDSPIYRFLTGRSSTDRQRFLQMPDAFLVGYGGTGER